MKRQLAQLLALVFSLLAPAALAPFAFAQDAPQGRLPTLPLSAGMYLIDAEVAADFRQRAAGLMQRTSIPGNAGMLFVFDVPGPQCMWMRNTLLPLSVAFIADDGSIVNIEDMQPKTDASHCAKREVRYALEMNQGWFKQRGILPGARISGLPNAEAPKLRR
jgi:uncharacterized membrane protein (UPF0127 family)